ncbi:MAG: hypothetical protein Q4D62_13675 [Planctomycetia bacterium]|nr:hypothetical protein [Planctomycetia bacterium]
MDQIRIIRTQTLNIMKEITEHPKPSYSLDGQSISWETYLKQLQSTIDWCDQRLEAEERVEIRTQAGT